MYEIFYDYDDDIFPSTLSEKVDTYEEAQKIAKNLKEHSLYSNIQIIQIGEV